MNIVARSGGVGILILSSCLAWSQPKLQVVEGTKLNFGTINRGTLVEKKVSLKNSGIDTLVIGAVEVSCGCTGTVVSEKRIPPGKTGTLLITFNSKNFSGPVHKSVTVNSNSATGERTLIEFTATVFEEVVVTPSQVLFRDAEIGQELSRTVVVQNNGKDRLLITGFKTQVPGLTLKLPGDPIAPNRSARITVELKPKEVQNVLSGLVYLTTSSKAQPEVTIYVYGNVKEFKFQ